MRLLVGYVLLTPFCGLLMYVTVAGEAATGFWTFNGPPDYGAALPLATAVTLFAAPPATALGAVPTVAWLMRRGQLTLRNLLLAGAALGTTPMIVLLVLAVLEKSRSSLPFDWSQAGRPMLIGAWFGLWCALFLWFVSIRGTELDRRATP